MILHIILQECIPAKDLYYYLRKRNIDIWRDQQQNMYFIYTM